MAIDPIIIDAIPVHGAHARAKTTKEEIVLWLNQMRIERPYDERIINALADLVEGEME